MFNSVRLRLTLWYTAVMACVLLVLASATFFLLKKNATHRTDAAAIEQADSFLKTVDAEVHDAAGPDSLQDGLSAAMSEHRFRDTLFFALDKDGNSLATSAVAPLDLQALLARTDRHQSELHTVHLGKQGYRSYIRKFSVDHQDCTLIVLQSLHPQEEFLETLTATFALIIPLAIFLSGAGGYLLVRRSLSPVAAMGAEAGQITADNLHARLHVQNAKDELGHLALAFNSLLDRLDLAFDQQRRFVADASHELRTPVAILCGESDVTLSKPDRTPEEYRESLNILRAEARRLKQIVEDLFTLARADAGQHPLQLSEFYLDELAAECVRNMRTLASAKRIALYCHTQKEMPIRADESLLRRMLLNLIDNAVKYTSTGGEVNIWCSEAEDTYSVSIIDTGEGIPAELHLRVFERFFRADKVRARSESGGGAGLGLSISLWIAQAHGGRVELTSSSPAGSTFTIGLPKAPANR